MKRLVPTYHHDTIELYFEDGVDSEAFRDVITGKYGRSLSDAAKDGSGLGLYISSLLMEKMNGELICSQSEDGFMVTLLIPLS